MGERDHRIRHSEQLRLIADRHDGLGDHISQLAIVPVACVGVHHLDGDGYSESLHGDVAVLRVLC